MPVQLFTNNASTTLAVAIDTVITTITVDDGSVFPSPTGGDWFYMTLQSGALLEIVQCTARTGNDLTVVRAQESTPGTSFSIGATCELRVTKAYLDRIHTLDSLPLASIGDVSGPASAVDNRVAFFLSGSNTGDLPPTDANLSTSDITTNNVSTSKHGFAPKAPNDDTQFLNGLGAYSVPAASIGEELIINGNMNLWQRGTSFTAIGLVHHADQWEHVEVSAGSIDVSRLAIDGDNAFHTASGVKLPYAMRYDVNTIDSTIVTGDVAFVEQKIEGYRALMYMHNQFTVSFYVRSNMTGAPNTFCFAIRNSDASLSFVKEFTIDVADTWERKTITVPTQGPSGTWNYKDGLGLDMSWCFMSGATFGSATDGVWNGPTNNYVATANQVNWMATATNNFDLAGVQVDLGPNAQPLRVVPIERDLVSAERYFQKSYNLDVDPGAVSALGQVVFKANSTTPLHHVALRTPMRVAPTVTEYNPTDGTAGQWEDVGVGGATTTESNVGMNGFEIALTVATDNNEVNGHWTVDATL
jgi:hypothetical protein